MKPSQYNYYFKYNDKEGIFNSFRGNIILLDSQKEKPIESNLNNLSQSLIEQYYRLGILINDNVNERDFLLQRRVQNINNKVRPFFRILTTTRCNAQCFYCYEEKKQHIDLSINTADKIIEFIFKKAASFGAVALQWFGGEPLLNYDIIGYINEKLARQKLKVYNTMISNGILFNREIVNVAKEKWNLKNIQITLDGMPIEHNKRKCCVNEQDAFSSTIDSIRMLSDAGIHVSIRLNHDSNNLDSMMSLIKLLGSLFNNKANITCYAYHIFDNRNYMCKENGLVNTYRLNKCIVENGLNTQDWLFRFLKQRNGLCGFCSNHTYVINPDGRLLKCSLDDLSFFGSIWSDILDNNVLSKWTNPVLDDKCNNCIFLPICQGGCRAAHFNNFTNTCNFDCESINEMLTDYITIKKLK